MTYDKRDPEMCATEAAPTESAPTRRGARKVVASTASVAALAALTVALHGGLEPASAQATDGSAGSSEAVRLLEDASDRYAAMNAFCAGFQQERIVPLLGQTTRSRGTLCQMHPGYFLMDFSDPDGDRIVADGRNLWIFYRSIDPGQVIRSRLGGPGTTFDFHGEFLDEPSLRFDAELEGTEEVTGRTTRVIRLRPREAVSYVEARVWLDPVRGLIRKVEIVEENESIRRVVLSDIEVDPEIPPERFRFEVPPGVRILDRDLPADR